MVLTFIHYEASWRNTVKHPATGRRSLNLRLHGQDHVKKDVKIMDRCGWCDVVRFSSFAKIGAPKQVLLTGIELEFYSTASVGNIIDSHSFVSRQCMTTD